MSTQETSFNPFKILIDFLNSTVGTKVIVALTGMAMWGFLIGHAAGNIQMFLPDWGEGGYFGKQINDYAHTLKTTTPLLWGTRLGLLGAVTLHIVFTIKLVLKNRAARPQRYHAVKSQKATIFGKMMKYSGIIVGIFIVFHLLHFTVGLPFSVDGIDSGVLELKDRTGQHDVYKMVWSSFKRPVIVVIYFVGQLMLFAHLVHGSQSVWQSLGLQNRSWKRIARIIGWTFVAFIAGFNIIAPIWILAVWPQFR